MYMLEVYIFKWLKTFFVFFTSKRYQIKGPPYSSGSVGKESACNAGDSVRSLSGEDPLEKKMVTHSSILAWKIPWTDEPGGL